MATEWYLLKPPNNLSGYENEALNDFAEESFLEVLDTDIAVSVELCNYDLSENTSIRAVIQNNVKDTKLQSLSRQMLVPIGTCKAGMYIKYKGRYWIIVGLVDDNTMYEKAILAICNWQLTWINSKQEIVQRWVNITSASQYNNGETGMQFYSVRSDQLLVVTPDDDECLLLENDARFIIDKRCYVYEKGYDESVNCDTSKSLFTYQLTRSDTVLFNYGDSGHFQFIATQDEQHDKDGFYKVNEVGYWLCEPPTINSDKKPILSCNISCESEIIYNGLEPVVFSAEFFDEMGNKVDVTPNWEIVSNFTDKLEITYIDNSIIISVDNPKLVNKSFELFLSGDEYETTSKKIAIKAFL